ncbi:NAD(P)H-dependent oxidoreductase [Pacificispira sp.]|uniref:NAD(P)H-dependent oxidoreductase n=1 Tax=Pacificispira sp. TaxID=2888761 RepID=UPI003BACFC92
MRVHIVHAHPEPESFNGALTETARRSLEGQGHHVSISDLYAEGFDPVESGNHYADRTDPDYFAALAEQRHAGKRNTVPGQVQCEIDRLIAADLVIFQFPIWWHGPPAILKGWFDRVFLSGRLYTGSMRYDRGFFRGKRALTSVTTGAPAAAFGRNARGGDMDQILWPVHYSLHYMGFGVLPPFAAHGVQGHGYAYRDAAGAAALRTDHLRRWSDHLEGLDRLSPIRFPGWDDWNEDGAPLVRAG